VKIKNHARNGPAHLPAAAVFCGFISILSCIDLWRKASDNAHMPDYGLDKRAEESTLDRSPSEVGNSNPHSLDEPLVNKVEGNEEFVKWWRRWASRLHRITLRKNPPSKRIRRGQSDIPTPTARAVSTGCEFERYL
jgi:hypothetical protein